MRRGGPGILTASWDTRTERRRHPSLFPMCLLGRSDSLLDIYHNTAPAGGDATFARTGVAPAGAADTVAARPVSGTVGKAGGTVRPTRRPRHLRVCAGVARPRRLPRRLGVDAGDDMVLWNVRHKTPASSAPSTHSPLRSTARARAALPHRASHDGVSRPGPRRPALGSASPVMEAALEWPRLWKAPLRTDREN